MESVLYLIFVCSPASLYHIPGSVCPFYDSANFSCGLLVGGQSGFSLCLCFFFLLLV
jgi:hypothetical protein